MERKREVAEDEPHLSRIGLEHLLERFLLPAAKRALEVGKLNQRHLGIGRSARRPGGFDLHPRLIEGDGDPSRFLERGEQHAHPLLLLFPV